METINETHLFSTAHQIGIDFSFLSDPLIMNELKMVFESEKDYDTLIIGKTREFGSNHDYTISLGER